MRVAKAILPFVLALPLSAQAPLRAKDVRNIAKGGPAALPRLSELLADPDTEIRQEAVKAIAEIDTQASLEPLVRATRDNDPEVQIRATDGLVNFYVPGYLRTGISGSLRRFGTGIKSRFTETNDQVIEPYVQVRADVIQALGRLVRGGGNMEARANAARAAGILRGRAALPGLLDALHSKDTNLIYESLIAVQKIRDASAAPGVRFLLKDLDPKVQLAAVETTGLLQNKAAVPDLRDVLGHSHNIKIQRAALSALAMLPEESSREVYARYLESKDEGLRSAAAEGFARLKSPADLPKLQKAFEEESKTPPRLALAFAEVMLGRREVSEFSPLQLLINTLNSVSYRGVASGYLVELARDPGVRASLYPAMQQGTKDEKIQIARVLARSGDRESIAPLEKLSRDGDTEVAQEGLRALRTLQARN